MSKSPALLDVAGLSAHYGLAQVLFDMSFSLHSGEVLALVGRNGAGKSTTLKALMRMVMATAQRVSFDGQDIRTIATHRIVQCGLGYVPEERRIFTDLSVAENLEVGRLPARPNRVVWTPERLFRIFPNLAEMQGRQASQMSGGEQQMLTIARTLMGNPLAVLLDEPSEGLAPIIVEQMAHAILAMKAEGMAVLLSEQNLAFASRVCDRVLVIETGHIRYAGSMAAMMSDTQVRERYLAI
jgi:branched-chain amino acid transport system ATP-binding protein